MPGRRAFIAGGILGSCALSAPRLAVEDYSDQATRVRVAAVQCPSNLGDVEGNTVRLTSLIRKAAAERAKIVVLPETSITGYLSQDLKSNWHLPGKPIASGFTGKDPRPFAQTIPGPATEHFCGLAKELGIYLTMPLLEKEGTTNRKADALYNSVALAAPTGKIVAHYRKLTPWPHPEQSWATPGDRGVQTFDTEYGRVGLAICFDIHTILEKYRVYKLWALLYPIAWVDDDHPAEWFWHTLPQRSKPFDHYVVGANWSVDKRPDSNWKGYGFSTILGRDGTVLSTAKSLFGDEIVYADLLTAKPATPAKSDG